MSVNLGQILEFLSHLHRSGKAYSTINIARSMLSVTLGSIGGFPIGSHPLVIKLMKGCYNRNPPKPKYESTWDPEVVLEFIRSLGSNEGLSFKDLSAKLVCLVALATLLRVSDIAGIDYESISIDEFDAHFSLSRPMKAQHSGPLKRIQLRSHQDDALICPLVCLRNYISRTDSFRSEDDGGNLILGLNAPHGPVTGSTVGRWIKELLGRARIDAVFSAHSTRSAAASAAVRAGVSIDKVLRSGHWLRKSTFDRFYSRP